MSRVVITSTADADTAHVIAELSAKAGTSVATRYNADFDYDLKSSYVSFARG